MRPTRPDVSIVWLEPRRARPPGPRSQGFGREEPCRRDAWAFQGPVSLSGSAKRTPFRESGSAARHISAFSHAPDSGSQQDCGRAFGPVSLTPAGAAFVERARAIGPQLRSVETAGTSAPAGSNFSPSRLSPERLTMIFRRWPRTRLSGFQTSGPEQAEALLRNRIDAGFMHPPEPEDSLLTFESVAKVFVVTLPSMHRRASRRRVLLPT